MTAIRKLFAILVVAPLVLAWSGFDPARLADQESVPGAFAPLTAGVLLGGFACTTPAWRFVRYVDTLFHEIGHAVAATLLGAKVRKITVHVDASGIAAYQMPADWGRFRRIAVAFVGYPFPAAMGVGLVVPLLEGSSVAAVWWLAGVVAAASIILLRNVWGLVVGAGVIAVLAGIASMANLAVVDAALSLLVGVLLAGSVRSAIEQIRLRDLTDSDAATIGRALYLPGRFVAFVQLVTCAALVAAAVWRMVAIG